MPSQETFTNRNFKIMHLTMPALLLLLSLLTHAALARPNSKDGSSNKLADDWPYVSDSSLRHLMQIVSLRGIDPLFFSERDYTPKRGRSRSRPRSDTVLGSEFLGKRSVEEIDNSEPPEKRLGSEFLGKRMGSEFLGKRMGSEFLGKRMGSEFLGKRMGSEFLGKRMGSEFLGKRMGSEFLGKRMGSEFLGKRSRGGIGSVSTVESSEDENDNDEDVVATKAESSESNSPEKTKHYLERRKRTLDSQN